MWLEWKDISLWENMEEMPCVVEWDMEELVAVKAELVESMDLTERSDGTDSWMPLTGSSYKVRADSQGSEDCTEVDTEVWTFVIRARPLFAWASPNVGRTEAQVVLVHLALVGLHGFL